MELLKSHMDLVGVAESDAETEIGMGKMPAHMKITPEPNCRHGRLKPTAAALLTVTCEGAVKLPDTIGDHPHTLGCDGNEGHGKKSYLPTHDLLNSNWSDEPV